MWCGWSRACRRPTRPRPWPAAPAATAPGCWSQVAAPPRPRRPLRLRLPDPAAPRHRGAGRAEAAPAVDFTDLHAWAEVYLPGAGWIGLDATSRPARRRRPHPAGRHPALPLRRADHGRVRLRPRSTSTSRWTSPAWSSRCASPSRSRTTAGRRSITLGEQIDADLGRPGRAPDHRAASRPSSPSTTSRRAEWNTDAVGPTKRGLADAMIRRFQARFAPGGLLHHGQGKWYPGEACRAGRLALFWRIDGQPIWRATPAAHRRRVRSPGEVTTPAQCRRPGLRRALRRPAWPRPGYVQAGLRGPGLIGWKEGSLPTMSTPPSWRSTTRPSAPACSKAFDGGAVAGARRLRAAHPALAQDRHASRLDERALDAPQRGHLFLVPGDSPSATACRCRACRC